MGQINKTTQELIDILKYQEGTTTGDDYGLNIVDGRLSVGEAGSPQKAVFGGGDSYPVVKAWHFDYANLSGLTLTGATDITDILQSDTGSTTGLFGGTTLNSAILVMSNVTYGGVKVKITTAGTVEPDNVTAEYLQDSSPTWVTSPFMATYADYPYTQRGNIIGSCASPCYEHWRFAFDPDNVPPTWDTVTININGTDYSGKFALFRVTSPITLDPVIEYMKMHTNRYKVNDEGTTENFGLSRFPKDLRIVKYTNTAKNPGNQNIMVASGVTILQTDNEFSATGSDGNIYVFTIPVGMDTSIPVDLEKRFYPNGSGAGGIVINCNVYKIKVGDLLDGTATASISLSKTITVDNQQYELMETHFKFFVNDLLPGDTVILDIYRDGTNGADTFASTMVEIASRAKGYFWRA